MSVSLCLLSLFVAFLRPCSPFGLVWFRLSRDHGWIRSGSVTTYCETNDSNKQQLSHFVFHRWFSIIVGDVVR